MPRPKRIYPPGFREEARALRQQGLTYREIIAELGGDIPKNTISEWVRDIELTIEQKDRIRQIELEARARGRPLAAEWHHEQKRQRLQDAEEWAEPLTNQVIHDANALILMASALWLGEGSRADDVLKFGNSDARIIMGWLEILRRCFSIDESKLACQLAISEGMPDQELKEYWSAITRIPLDRFHKSSIKKGQPPIEREGYKGVCTVVYFSAALRRQIGALGYQILDKLTNQ